MCHRRQQERVDLDALALVDPELAALQRELQEYSIETELEFQFAVRSALLIGRPASLAQTHILKLNFLWDPSTPTLREHFQLHSAIVVPLEEVTDLGPGTEDFLEGVRKAGRCGKPDDPVREGGSEAYYGFVFNVWMRRDLKKTAAKVKAFRSDPRSFEHFVPLLERDVNLEWEEQLRQSLAQKRRSYLELDVEDSVGSVGKERFVAAVRRKGGPGNCLLADIVERTY
ncbi:hypothetical protein P7C70_g2826, partial [Phenoliferia sp. Uapishka_3]